MCAVVDAQLGVDTLDVVACRFLRNEQLVGNLTIRDVSKEVSLDVEGPSAIIALQREERTVATGTTKINRFDFGLKWNNLIETGGAVVGPEVAITIDLEVTRPRS